MPYCECCGRPLENGQICNCTANQNPNFNQQIQSPPPIYGQNVYTNTVDMTNAPKKKLGVGTIILIIAIPLVLIVLVVCGILAAILVPSMIGYTNKSKLVSQNSYSTSICKAINSALCEMDEEGYEIGGNYFICSNANNSFCFDSESDDLDYDDLNDRINEFFSDSINDKWFAVCENGVVTYVASAESWDSKFVGTYPSSALDAQKGYEKTYYDDTQELGEIYEDALEAIYYSY